MQNMPYPEIQPTVLNEKISAGEQWTILDVREDDELAIAALDGARHIPMGELPTRLAELDKAARIAVLCHSGGRSARVTIFLLNQGFTNTLNIAGGIDRWSVEVDKRLSRY